LLGSTLYLIEKRYEEKKKEKETEVTSTLLLYPLEASPILVEEGSAISHSC
jgi:hypothetical protein